MPVISVWYSEGRKSQYLILPLVEKYQPNQRAGSKRVSSVSQINNKMFYLPVENEVLERLANLFVSGDFNRVSCERGATCNIAQPSKYLEEK